MTENFLGRRENERHVLRIWIEGEFTTAVDAGGFDSDDMLMD
jgi:hypothetical protein